MNKEIEGKRFSINYISHPELLPDSTRMRRRLGLLFFRFQDGSELRKNINRELGLDLKNSGCSLDSYWAREVLSMELRDALDIVTLVYTNLAFVAGYSSEKRQPQFFINGVRRIFSEENVRYSVDDFGGVHFAVDQAFEQTRLSSVLTLNSPRYEAVRKALDESYQALDRIPSDGKLAIRSIFFANESLFRLIYPSAHQLGVGEIAKNLKPSVDQKYNGKNPANHVAQKQIKQFQDWIEGAHFYRHEPGSEEPNQPPIEMAIHYVTAGTAWLRWLREFDQNV